MNRPWTFPWPSSVIVSLAAWRGFGFFLLEAVGLVGVRKVGGDDFQQPAAEDPQRLRVVLARGCDQVLFGLDDRSGSRSSGRARTARMITRACSSRRSPERARPGRGRGCRGRSRGAPPGAAARVCRVWWASQFAVDVAPTSVPTWTSSACAATRAFSSTTWASRRVSSTNVDAASAALMDHTDASTTASATARICAVAEATWWWGAVIAGHGSNSSTDHRQSEAQKPLIHRGSGHEQVTIRGARPHPAVVVCGGWFRGSAPSGASHLNHRSGLEAGGGPQATDRRTRRSCLSAADPTSGTRDDAAGGGRLPQPPETVSRRPRSRGHRRRTSRRSRHHRSRPHRPGRASRGRSRRRQRRGRRAPERSRGRRRGRPSGR